MGLAGRAALLADSGAITDAREYLDLARNRYSRLGPLAGDLAQGLVDEDRQRFSIWSDWEREGARPLVVQVVRPERYALTFFSVRLIELVSEAMSGVDLQGHASRVLDWFTANADGILQHAQLGPDLSAAHQRELAVAALGEAVRRDEVAADEEMIQRELSSVRIAGFTADVYATAFSDNTVERLFDHVDGLRWLPAGADDSPEPLVWQGFDAKGFFSDEPEGSGMHYGNPDGAVWGRAMVEHATQGLIGALADATEAKAALDSPEELLNAMEATLSDLEPTDPALLLFAGDWDAILAGLTARYSDRYEDVWQIPPAERIGDAERLARIHRSKLEGAGCRAGGEFGGCAGVRRAVPERGAVAQRSSGALRARSRGCARRARACWREARTRVGAVNGRQAGSGSARNRTSAAASWSAQGQRFGRCRVQRRAECVSRPARAK